MKRSNLKIFNIVLLIAISIAAGCTKWMVEVDKDPTNLSPDSYYTLPGHADAAIASAYAQTRFIGGGAGIFATNFSMLELVTGTARTETGQNTDLNNLLGLSYNGENVFVSNWWNGPFSVIAQANLVLDKVPGIQMDEAVKKKILGEATFLRAWAYFYLVRLYGDVPLLTTPIYSATDEKVYASRTSKDSVYAQIVDDLKAAETAGLPTTDAGGRASLGAAKALLAEVYLTMAGAPLNKGQEYYTLAAQKAGEVTGYSLFPDYNSLHDEAKENIGEQIFMIQYLGGVANNDMQTHMLPNFKDVSAYDTEVGSTVPSGQFFNTFEAGDKRVVDREGFFYTSYYDKGFEALKNLGAPYVFKHFDINANGTLGKKGSTTSGLNRMNIRFAQVLLTFAEAANEAAAAPPQAAYDALKAIRDRAGLTTPAIGTFTKDSFRNLVLAERWHELCYEGITWFDMVRLKKGYNFTTKTFENFVGYKLVESGAVLEEKHLLFPLPTIEMQNNPNLRPQNPGYPGV
jgi:hypothetical protein